MDAQPKKESNNLKVPGEQSHRTLDAAIEKSRTWARGSSSTPATKRTVKSCVTPAARSVVRRIAGESLPAALLCMGLACAAPSFVAAATLPSKPQAQSASSKAVQPQVEKQASDAAAQKRKALLADATAAIAETEQALKALDENKKDVALKALADATGKLELVIARDPGLALAPVHVDAVTHDLFANPGTVSAVLLDVRKSLDAGNVQDARRLIAALASDIEVHTTNIPLATYPAAIRASRRSSTRARSVKRKRSCKRRSIRWWLPPT